MEKKIIVKVLEIKNVSSRKENEDKDFQILVGTDNDKKHKITIQGPESYFDGVNPKDEISVLLSNSQQTLLE